MIVNRQTLNLNGNALFDRIRFKLPLNIQGNMQHEACFFMSCNVEGKLYTPKENVDVFAEEAILMKCGNYVRHLNSALKEKEISEILLIHFYPDTFDQIYQNELPHFLKPTSKPIETYIEKLPLTDLLENYIKSIYFYFEHPRLVTDDLLALKLKELIVLLINSDTTGNVQALLQSFFQPNEYEFKQIIDAHIFQTLSIQELAFLCNLSVSSFQRKFKVVYNDSPAHYIKAKRLNKACELLKVGNLNIVDICYECGFSAPNYFTKVFKKVFGMTPTEYRKRQNS